MDAHANQPKPAWHYLGDGKQLGRGSVDFALAVWEINRFEAWFPLEAGWSWPKVLALYGVDVFGHERNGAVDWSAMGPAWAEAAHISHRDGWPVPASALVRGIDWRLSLCLGHPDWSSWSGPQRIAALLVESENVEEVSIAGLV